MPADSIAATLASSLTHLRRARNLSQNRLSIITGIPRSTISHIESGSGNPSLENLARLSRALQITIEELLTQPRPAVQLVQSQDIRLLKKARGAAHIFKLLPDPIPGMEIDRLILESKGRLSGTPHVEGTKEYFYTVSGIVRLTISGESFEVKEGDLLAFSGAQPHSYYNPGNRKAHCFSVVTYARLSV